MTTQYSDDRLPADLRNNDSLAARWIYRQLQATGDGRLRISTITRETGMTVRGIRKAVVDLEGLDLAHSEWSQDDARERVIVLEK
jgi:hypothetical protein